MCFAENFDLRDDGSLIGTNVVSAMVKTFDLCIQTKQGTEHQFRGIQRNEWQPLFDFMVAKNLSVENMESVRQGPAQHVSSVPLEDMDVHGPGFATCLKTALTMNLIQTST